VLAEIADRLKPAYAEGPAPEAGLLHPRKEGLLLPRLRGTTAGFAQAVQRKLLSPAQSGSLIVNVGYGAAHVTVAKDKDLARMAFGSRA
jgi:hypothetical protein